MARVPALSREDVPEEERYIYDEILESRGAVRGPFQVLMNSPQLARRTAHLGSHIRFESTLPASVQELIVLAIAREWDCQYAWTDHEPLARKAGVRDEAIQAIKNRTAPRDLNEEEAIVVRYVQEVILDHRVSEETFGIALKRFGIRGVTEFTATLGYFLMVVSILNAFDVNVDPGTKPLIPL